MFRNRALLLIFITVFIDLVGFGIVIPVLPIFAKDMQANAFQIGLLIASFSFTQFLATPFLGRLSDKYGRKIILSVSLLGTALGFFLTAVAHSIVLLFIGRIVDGFTGGNISTAQAYIADVTPKKERAAGMGLVGAAFGLGFIFGPAVGGLLSQISYRTPFYFAAALALINGIAIQFYLPESNIKGSRRHASFPLRKLFSLSVLKEALRPFQVAILISIFFVFNLSFSMIYGTFPLLSNERFSWSAVENGFAFATIGIVSAVTQLFLLRRLVNKFSEIPIALIGLIILALAMSLVGFTSLVPLLFFSALVMAVGIGLSQPTIQGLISRYSQQDEQGVVLGISEGLASLGRTLGPIFGGFLYSSYGSGSPYFIGAGILLLMSVSSFTGYNWLKHNHR